MISEKNLLHLGTRHELTGIPASSKHLFCVQKHLQQSIYAREESDKLKKKKKALCLVVTPDNSLIFKLSNGLSSYDEAESSLPRQAQQHRQIRATNAIQATDKPAITVPLLSLLLLFGSGLEAFFILVTSGRASASKEKRLLVACFAEGGGAAMANAPSSRSLLFIAKGGLLLLELGKLLACSSCCCPCSEKGGLRLFKQSRNVLATSAGDKVAAIASSILIL
jgi:hypothetical protein